MEAASKLRCRDPDSRSTAGYTAEVNAALTPSQLIQKVS